MGKLAWKRWARRMLEMKILNLHTISITESSSARGKYFANISPMWLLHLLLISRWWVEMLKFEFFELRRKKPNKTMMEREPGRDGEKVCSTLTKSGLIFAVNSWINYIIWVEQQKRNGGWGRDVSRVENIFICLFTAEWKFSMLQKQQQTSLIFRNMKITFQIFSLSVCVFCRTPRAARKTRQARKERRCRRARKPSKFILKFEILFNSWNRFYLLQIAPHKTRNHKNELEKYFSEFLNWNDIPRDWKSFSLSWIYILISQSRGNKLLNFMENIFETSLTFELSLESPHRDRINLIWKSQRKLYRARHDDGNFEIFYRNRELCVLTKNVFKYLQGAPGPAGKNGFPVYMNFLAKIISILFTLVPTITKSIAQPPFFFLSYQTSSIALVLI